MENKIAKQNIEYCLSTICFFGQLVVIVIATVVVIASRSNVEDFYKWRRDTCKR
jgi:hypothetical protein